MSEPHRHRPHDHLVEPMFGGLGVEAPPVEPPGDPTARADVARPLALFGRVLVVLAVIAAAWVAVLLLGSGR